MPGTLRAAVMQIYFIAIILYVHGARAELALSQVPLWGEAGACGRACASAVSSQYSTALRCPQNSAAACLCSLELLSLVADAASLCCRVSCTASAYAATDYALPYAGQHLMSSYCAVNAFSTPTVAPSPATQGPVSNSSWPSASGPQPSNTASIVPRTSTRIIASTSSTQPSVVATSSNIPNATSSGNTSPAGLAPLGIVAITMGAVIFVVLTTFIILAIANPHHWRTRSIENLKGYLKSILSKHHRRNHNMEEEGEKAPKSGSDQNEVISEDARMSSVPAICTRRQSSESAESNGFHFSKTVYSDSDIVRPEPYLTNDVFTWNQPLVLYSKIRDGKVRAIAILDSGAEDNWISPEKIEEGKFDTQAVDDSVGEYHAFNGTGFRPTLRTVISWEGERARKRRETRFYVAPPGSRFDVLLGRKFIEEERIVLPNPAPHVFSRRY